MNESENSPLQDNTARGGHADQTISSFLIADLASDDGLLRERTRQSTVAIGGPAVAPLIEALADPNQQVMTGGIFHRFMSWLLSPASLSGFGQRFCMPALSLDLGSETCLGSSPRQLLPGPSQLAS